MAEVHIAEVERLLREVGCADAPGVYARSVQSYWSVLLRKYGVPEWDIADVGDAYIGVSDEFVSICAEVRRQVRAEIAKAQPSWRVAVHRVDLDADAVSCVVIAITYGGSLVRVLVLDSETAASNSVIEYLLKCEVGALGGDLVTRLLKLTRSAIMQAWNRRNC